MQWLIDEVFAQAAAIGDQLAGAYNEDEVPVGVYKTVRMGDTISPATKGIVFKACCQEELARMISGLKRAGLELTDLPPGISAEIRNLQRIVNGAVGTISYYDGATYYAGTDIGECGKRGWSAVIRHLKGLPFPSAEAAPEKSKLTPPAPAEVGAVLSPAATAILCEDLIQAIDEYFQWHKLMPPPHQVGTLEGVLIGDFGAMAGDFEARRIRAAVWVRDNGPALATALERHNFDSLPILRMVGLIDDPDAVPSTFLPLWKDTKATLKQAAIQLRKEPAPAVADPKQGGGAGDTGSVSTRAGKVRNFHTDPPETIQELVFLWLRTAERSRDKDPWVADLIREAILKAPGGSKIENSCLVRFGEFTFTTTQRLLAEVALSRGQTFADYLPLTVSAVADYLPDPPPTGTPKRGAGNGGADLLARKLPHAKPARDEEDGVARTVDPSERSLTGSRMTQVFISYAHSSPEHKQTVSNLVAALREKGLAVMVDADVKTPQGPPEGWPKWMKRQIRDADWVLLLFDAVYRRRFDGEEEPDRGLGATWEGAIITHHFYRDATRNKKFIPLLADGAGTDLIPSEFFGYTHYFIPTQADELAVALRPHLSSSARENSEGMPGND